MRVVRPVVSVLLMLVGAVWFFQGIGILKGSFMTGQTLWTIIGIIAFLVGLQLWPRASGKGRRRGR